MNKIMMVAGAVALASLASGCASSGGNPMLEWQGSRFKAEQINTAKANGKLPQLEDVLYKSLNNGNGLCAPLAVPIDAVSPVPAALYLQVVIGVDKMLAAEEGRAAMEEYYRLLEGRGDDEKKWTKEEIFAKWAKDDAARKEKEPNAKSTIEAIKEYKAFVANSDPDTLIPIINDIINVQIPKALENVQKTIQTVLDDAKSGKLKLEATGLELLGGLKNTGNDGAALGKQLADTGVGAAYWLKLAMADSDAKKDLSKFDNILN